MSREEQVERAATILNRLRSVLDCELVSGGGTGTYDLSTHLDEIQAGSYVLMDASYDKVDLPFELALACRTTIVSRNGTRAVCDAGLKALSAEYGLPRAVDPAIEVVGLADEHATLTVPAESELAVGDAILLIPAHVDPTVNLHAALHAVEAGGTVHRWPVVARSAGGGDGGVFRDERSSSPNGSTSSSMIESKSAKPSSCSITAQGSSGGSGSSCGERRPVSSHVANASPSRPTCSAAPPSAISSTSSGWRLAM